MILGRNVKAGDISVYANQRMITVRSVDEIPVLSEETDEKSIKNGDIAEEPLENTIPQGFLSRLLGRDA